MFKKHSDKKLVEGLRKGDNKTLNYLYDNYFDTVRSHIMKNSGSEDDAYDIFQEAIMFVFKKFQHNGVELTCDLKGYVFGIARKLWSNKLRIKKESRIEPGTDVVDDNELEKFLDIPIEEIVQRSVRKLSPEAQKILALHFEGRDYEYIAEIMGYKNAGYARRKKYLIKEELVKIVKADPDFKDYDGNFL